MKEIPAEIVARWSPMWAHGTVLARPWWRMHVVEVWPDRWTREAHYRWERADGKTHGGGTVVSSGGNGRDFFAAAHVYQPNEADMAALAAIDAAHPLPAPEPMPGQVWVYPDGCENLYLFHTPDGAPRVPGRLESERPPPGAILVAGPTPWGRDIPWSPA